MEKRIEFLLKFIDFSLYEFNYSQCPNCNKKGRIAGKKILDKGWDNEKRANIGVFKSMCANCEHEWEEETTYYNI